VKDQMVLRREVRDFLAASQPYQNKHSLYRSKTKEKIKKETNQYNDDITTTTFKIFKKK
jgi:hypothetical protein